MVCKTILSTFVFRLAAKKLIQVLQDRDDNESHVKKEIIELGCQYGNQLNFKLENLILYFDDIK